MLTTLGHAYSYCAGNERACLASSLFQEEVVLFKLSDFFLLKIIRLCLSIFLSLELSDQNSIQTFPVQLEACPRTFSIHGEA